MTFSTIVGAVVVLVDLLVVLRRRWTAGDVLGLFQQGVSVQACIFI